MAAWPISKVVVLLIDPERKKCLIEHTQGVWSIIIEKEFDEAHSSNRTAVRKSANKRTWAELDGADMLQELALSEVERKTGTYLASVRLRCPNVDMTIYGGPRKTPLEARFSAAANMIWVLNKAT